MCSLFVVSLKRDPLPAPLIHVAMIQGRLEGVSIFALVELGE